MTPRSDFGLERPTAAGIPFSSSKYAVGCISELSTVPVASVYFRVSCEELSRFGRS